MNQVTIKELQKKNDVLERRIAELERSESELRQAEEALRASETKFRMLYRSITDAFAAVDMTGRILDYNESFLTMLGYGPEEIGPLTYRDITPAKWHPMEADIIRDQVLTRGYSDIYEKEYIRKDGTVFPVELRTTLLRDAKGIPVVMWAIVRDITDRKQKEEALRKRVKELNCLYAIADLIEEATPLDDLLQKVVDQLPSGWSHPEHACARIACKVREFKTANFRETGWKLAAEVLADGKPFGVIEVFYLEGMPSRDEGPFLSEERSLIRAVAERLGRVIERTRMEGALRESETRFKRLAENSPGVVYQLMTDPEGRYSFPYINEKLQAVTGVSSLEVTRDISVFISRIHPDDLQMFHADILASTAELAPYHAVFRFRKEDRYIWLEARSTPERMPDGSILWEGFFLDITERRNEREELLRTQFAMDCAPDSILWVDDEGRIIYANDTACAWMGYAREELQAMKIFDIDPDFPPALWEEHKREMRERGTMAFVSRHITKDGHTFPVEVRSNFFKFHDRWLTCAFDRDITHRRQAEKEREELIAELQKALSEVKTLSGLIPICASCKKIRDDRGYWNQIESYIKEHSEAEFSHGICPDCAAQFYATLEKP